MFGEHMIRYMPVLLQNVVAENFNASLDAPSLELFKAFQTKKIDETKNNLKEKYNLFNYCRESEERMRRRQNDLSE